MSEETGPAKKTGKYYTNLYYFEIVGYFCSAIPTAAIFYYQQRSWVFWALLLLVQIMPHLGFFLKKNWYCFKEIEKYSFAVPCIFFSFFWGVTGYSILYGATLLTIFFTSLVTILGPQYIWRIIYISAPAALYGGYLNQFAFTPDANITLLFVYCFTLFFFLTIYGLAMNGSFIYLRKIRRKFAEEKGFFESVNKVILEASSSFSTQKILQVILDAVNEYRNFDCVSLIAMESGNKTSYVYGTYGQDSTSKARVNIKPVAAFVETNHALLSNYFSGRGIDFINKDLINEKTGALDEFLMEQKIFRSLLAIPLRLENQIIGIAILFSFQAEQAFMESDFDFIEKFIPPISALINNTLLHKTMEEQKIAMEKNRITYESISSGMSKYLSSQIYRHIFSNANASDISSKRKYLTIFLSELAGYTDLYKTLDHEICTSILNNFLDKMSTIAMKYDATVDKYMGDSMLIFFGDPETAGMEKDAAKCTNMAIAMRNAVKELQVYWHGLGITTLSLRVGINSGYCNVGNFGSHHHMEYTIIGNQINLTSRILAIAKPNEILISESTYLHVHGAIQCKAPGVFRAKGFTDVFKIYQVVDVIHSGGEHHENP